MENNNLRSKIQLRICTGNLYINMLFVLLYILTMIFTQLRLVSGIYLELVNENNYRAVFSVANTNFFQPFVAHPCIAQQSVLRGMPVSSLPQPMPPLPVSNQMPTITGSKSMSPIASLPIEVPKLLTSFVSNVAVTFSVAIMSPSKLATVLISASLSLSQMRDRKRPPNNPHIVVNIYSVQICG